MAAELAVFAGAVGVMLLLAGLLAWISDRSDRP